jgi:hypothetical protein
MASGCFIGLKEKRATLFFFYFMGDIRSGNRWFGKLL